MDDNLCNDTMRLGVIVRDYESILRLAAHERERRAKLLCSPLGDTDIDEHAESVRALFDLLYRLLDRDSRWLLLMSIRSR